MSEDKNTLTQEQIEALGVSPEVAEQFRTEIEAELKPAEPVAPAENDAPDNDAPDQNENNADVLPPASQVPPTATGVEADSEDDLTKQYPGGNVPIAALMAERKKRQELERQIKSAPFQQTPAPASVVPQVPANNTAPAPAASAKLDLESKEFNRRLTKEAVSLWEQENPGEDYDPLNPAHMAEIIENKNTLKKAYADYQVKQDQEYQRKHIEQQVAQQINYERQIMAATYGDQFDAIDNYASTLLKNDPREMYYIQGELGKGNIQPLKEFMEKAVTKYREQLTPKPNLKTDADKMDELNALPRSNFLPSGEKGKSRTMSDIEKMIADGSWAKLPEHERSLILEQVGGGAI